MIIGDVSEYACTALRASMSITPTKKERKLADSLLTWCESVKKVSTHEAAIKNALAIIRETADRWNDSALFSRAIRACGADADMDRIGVNGLISAYQAFSWADMKDL